MNIKNAGNRLEYNIILLIEKQNAKVYKEFKTESDQVQSNYDIGLLTTAELMMQQFDLLSQYKKELISITNN